MPPLTTHALRAQIASGETAPLYLLTGADDVEQSAVAGEFAEMVDEGLRAFNLDRFYGGEVHVDDLIASANTLPMMVPRRVVVVLEAEQLFVPKREGKAAEADQERLEAFLADPSPLTTIVFVCGTVDMRRRIVKWLFKEAFVVDCGTIADEADAKRWVVARATRDRIPLDPGAVSALVARTGPDLGRLRAGLERVALYAMGQKSISAGDVREAVVAGPEVQADFGVAKAIWRGDVREALEELRLALEAGAVPIMMMGQLRTAAEKLPGHRLTTAIEHVLRTDLALKSSGADARLLLERLVVELCEEPSRGRGPGVRRPPYPGRADWRQPPGARPRR